MVDGRGGARAGVRSTRAGAFLTALLGASLVAAEPAPRLVFVGDGADGTTARRLIAEARALGYATEVDRLATLGEASARDGDAAGFIAVGPASTVEAWLMLPDRRRPPTIFLLVPRADEGGRFAFRVIEEIRANLSEILIPAAPPAPPALPVTAGSAPTEAQRPAPAAAKVAPAERPPPRGSSLGLGAGVGALVPAGIDATAELALGARLRRPQWGVALDARIPLSRAQFAASEGTGSVATWRFGARAFFVAFERNAWTIDVAAGGGAVLVTFHGDPAAGFTGRDGHALAGYFFAAPEVSLRLTSWLAARAEVLVGAVAPRPVFDFDGHQVAALGRVFASAALLAEGTIPLGKRR